MDDELPGRRADEAPQPDLRAWIDACVRETFDPYEVRRDGALHTYFVEEPPGGYGPAFDALLAKLKTRGFLPLLRKEGGEHILRIVPSPPVPRPRIFMNVALYLATWVTTTLAGAWTWFVYHNADFCIECYGADASSLALAPTALMGGLITFALPLMLILTVHEMGHYIASRRHGLAPSLPYFIPLPPLFPVNIGTLGAFISLREPIPTRKALLDIGASGPIAGLLVAIPLIIAGVAIMAANPVFVPDDATSATLGTPLLYMLISAPFGVSDNAYIHPTALAGWVGLLVTGINLLPAGQLDGGHIATAWLGRRAGHLGVAAIAVLLFLGLGWPPFAPVQALPGYGGWLLFALLILLMGAQHPPTLNDVSELHPARKALAIGSLLLLFVTFTPVPIS